LGGRKSTIGLKRQRQLHRAEQGLKKSWKTNPTLMNFNDVRLKECKAARKVTLLMVCCLRFWVPNSKLEFNSAR
jgi:hypothetical protein